MNSDYKTYLLKQLGIKESQLKSKYPAVDPDELEMGTEDERDEHHMSQADAERTALQHLAAPDQTHYYTGMEKAKDKGMLKDEQNISPTAMRSPVIAIAVRGSSTGGFPSGLDQTGITPDTPTGRLGGYEPIIPNPVNSKLVDKTPTNIAMQSPNPINDHPETTNAVTHPFQVQKHTGEPPQDVTGASTDSNIEVPYKTTPPDQNIDIDIPGNDMDGQETMGDEEKMKAGVPNEEGDMPRQNQEINETFKRHKKLMQKRLGLITETATCKCGDSECTCRCKMTECGTCGCGKPHTVHPADEGIGDGEPSPSKWKMDPNKAGMVKVGEASAKRGPLTKDELAQIWAELHPATPDTKEEPVRFNPHEEPASIPPHKIVEPPEEDPYTGGPMPDTHGNIKLDEKKGKVSPEEMHRALDRLNRQNPAAYAQLLVLPLSYVPAYAWEDPDNEWWSGEEAKMKLQQIKDACHEGPKPNPKGHVPKPSDRPEPPFDYAKWGSEINEGDEADSMSDKDQESKADKGSNLSKKLSNLKTRKDDQQAKHDASTVQKKLNAMQRRDDLAETDQTPIQQNANKSIQDIANTVLKKYGNDKAKAAEVLMKMSQVTTSRGNKLVGQLYAKASELVKGGSGMVESAGKEEYICSKCNKDLSKSELAVSGRRLIHKTCGTVVTPMSAPPSAYHGYGNVKEQLDESYTPPFARMRGLAGLGKTVLCSNGMWSNTTIKEGWAMGQYTPAQQSAIDILSRKGFREVGSFPNQPDAEGQGVDDKVTVVLQRKKGPFRTSVEVDADGSCNGQPVDAYLRGSISDIHEAGASRRKITPWWEDKVNEINHTTDASGKDAIAVGAPGSDARNAIEKGTPVPTGAPETSDEPQGIYPPSTIQMNKMGSLHVWQGAGKPVQIAKYNWEMDGREADIYVQHDGSIADVLEHLTPEERRDVEAGWDVVTRNLPDDYFNMGD